MKMSVALAALLLPVLGSGCGTPSVSFDVPINAEAEIDGGGGGILDPLLGAFGFDGFNNLNLETTKEFENNDVRREQVTSARIKSLNLTIVSPQGANFDFLDEISFSVAAEGEDKALVASKTIDNGLTAVALDLEDVQLAPFVQKSSFAITTQADGNQPPNDTTIQVDLVFGVTAEVF